MKSRKRDNLYVNCSGIMNRAREGREERMGKGREGKGREGERVGRERGKR